MMKVLLNKVLFITIIVAIVSKKSEFCHASIGSISGSNGYSSYQQKLKKEYTTRSIIRRKDSFSVRAEENNNRNNPSFGILRAAILDVRGGTLDDDDYDDEEETSDEEDFDFDDLMAEDMELGDDDFGEDNTVERIINAFKETPPLTKLFLTGSFAVTLYGYILNKNEFPSLLLLEYKPLLTKLQLWRPITSFLNFGPFGIGYVMTAQFVWTYMSTLERLNHDKPYDFWIMILFAQLSMIIGYPLLKLSPRFLGHNLSTFLVYVWSRYHEGVEVNMFELFNTRAELLPWFFLAQTFLLEGEPPILDFLGIVFGHIYYHCKTIGLLKAPPSLSNWYHKGTNRYAVRMREKYKKISSEFEMEN